ncbi:MAG TPA: hypothetical protein VJX23_06395 [Candidatus Binataceae bacterium]|nr:hypothetical protein [Candidatus Binataceae bacterium]
MVRSFLIGTLLAAAIATAACSTTKPPAPSRPVSIEGTSTLTITNGIRVIGSVPLPRGFSPIDGRAPLWLENGTELGLVGSIDGHVTVLGLSGSGWHNTRVLAAETGEDAAVPGNIVDVAASPNGMTLATAVAVPSEKRLDIVVRDLIAVGSGHPITSFDGTYDLVEMHWLTDSTVAIVLRPHPEPASAPIAPVTPPAPDEPPPPPPAKPSEGLQLLVVTGAGSVAPVKLPCAMSVLQWSPDGAYAVSMGDEMTAPVLIDRRKSTCTPLRATPPVRVLSWEPEDESAFLYVQPATGGKSRGVFEHDISSGKDRLIAVSSGAASYVGNGPILAYGNQRLTWKLLDNAPLAPVVAELAIFDPDKPEIDIKQLGFTTLPPMMADSSMSYSRGTDRALIQTYQPAIGGPMRKLIVYTVHSDSAFQIGSGPTRGLIQSSWSPRGHWLAVLDGDTNGSMLTVISPPG